MVRARSESVDDRWILCLCGKSSSDCAAPRHHTRVGKWQFIGFWVRWLLMDTETTSGRSCRRQKMHSTILLRPKFSSHLTPNRFSGVEKIVNHRRPTNARANGGAGRCAVKHVHRQCDLIDLICFMVALRACDRSIGRNSRKIKCEAICATFDIGFENAHTQRLSFWWITIKRYKQTCYPLVGFDECEFRFYHANERPLNGSSVCACARAARKCHACGCEWLTKVPSDLGIERMTTKIETTLNGRISHWAPFDCTIRITQRLAVFLFTDNDQNENHLFPQ